jgi:hypothetical protein
MHKAVVKVKGTPVALKGFHQPFDFGVEEYLFGKKRSGPLTEISDLRSRPSSRQPVDVVSPAPAEDDGTYIRMPVPVMQTSQSFSSLEQ